VAASDASDDLRHPDVAVAVLDKRFQRGIEQLDPTYPRPLGVGSAGA
jgi:hypothetical protein